MLITQLNRALGAGASPYHTGFVVADLDAAMAELHNAWSLTWREPVHVAFTAQSPNGELDMVWRSVYSIEGPPYIELGELDQKSHSHPSMQVGSAHVGFWSDDVAADDSRLQEAGMSLLFRVPGASDGSPIATFHVAQSGIVVEMVRRELMASVVGETS